MKDLLLRFGCTVTLRRHAIAVQCPEEEQNMIRRDGVMLLVAMGINISLWSFSLQTYAMAPARALLVALVVALVRAAFDTASAYRDIRIAPALGVRQPLGSGVSGSAVGFALLASIITCGGIEHALFAQEIEADITAQRNADNAAVRTLYEGQRPALHDRLIGSVESDIQEVTARRDAAEKHIETLKGARAEAESDLSQRRIATTREREGLEGNDSGQGPNYRVRVTEQTESARRFKSVAGELNAESLSLESLNKRLDDLRNKLVDRHNDYDDAVAELGRRMTADPRWAGKLDGPLVREMALWRLSMANPIMLVSRVLGSAFLVALECLFMIIRHQSFPTTYNAVWLRDTKIRLAEQEQLYMQSFAEIRGNEGSRAQAQVLDSDTVSGAGQAPPSATTADLDGRIEVIGSDPVRFVSLEEAMNDPQCYVDRATTSVFTLAYWNRLQQGGDRT